MLLLFAVDTALSWHQLRLGFDLPLERDVQAIGWGPLEAVMNATNWVADYRQAVLWLLLSAALLPLTRRGALLFFAGALASGVEEALKRLADEPRPPAALVHVQTPDPTFGYPSGHATFYTWVVLLLLFVLHAWIPRGWRPLAWAVGAFLIFAACLGRIWAGEHWPSQVIGGFLLGGGWALLLMALSASVSWRADKTAVQT